MEAQGSNGTTSDTATQTPRKRRNSLTLPQQRKVGKWLEKNKEMFEAAKWTQPHWLHLTLVNTGVSLSWSQFKDVVEAEDMKINAARATLPPHTAKATSSPSNGDNGQDLKGQPFRIDTVRGFKELYELLNERCGIVMPPHMQAFVGAVMRKQAMPSSKPETIQSAVLPQNFTTGTNSPPA